MSKLRYHFYRISAPFVTVMAMIFWSSVAMGDVGGGGPITAPTNVVTSPTDVQNLFCAAMLWMFWGLIVFSIIMFLVGGYIYATASDNPERVSKAHKTLLYAAIGVVIAITAKGVPLLIGSLLGVSASQLGAC